jgi:hypothetical protein
LGLDFRCPKSLNCLNEGRLGYLRTRVRHHGD